MNAICVSQIQFTYAHAQENSEYIAVKVQTNNFSLIISLVVANIEWNITK